MGERLREKVPESMAFRWEPLGWTESGLTLLRARGSGSGGRDSRRSSVELRLPAGIAPGTAGGVHGSESPRRACSLRPIARRRPGAEEPP
ncbi:MAG: hypothetical protein EA421_12520 [Gemmatimonadales bacterium]|nr:MAG: hypothetical protein EA421_12520 [Gemmatimonadales bacterium]